jgi:hypothetical protein
MGGGGKIRTRKIDRGKPPGSQQDAEDDWVLFHAGEIPAQENAAGKRGIRGNAVSVASADCAD